MQRRAKFVSMARTFLQFRLWGHLSAEAKVAEKFGQDDTAEVKTAKWECTANPDSERAAETEHEMKP